MNLNTEHFLVHIAIQYWSLEERCQQEIQDVPQGENVIHKRRFWIFLCKVLGIRKRQEPFEIIQL